MSAPVSAGIDRESKRSHPTVLSFTQLDDFTCWVRRRVAAPRLSQAMPGRAAIFPLLMLTQQELTRCRRADGGA